WGGMDRCAVCLDVEPIDCGNRLGMDGRLGTNSLCSWPGLVHAGVAGEDSPQVCHPLRGADRATDRIAGPGNSELRGGGGPGSVSIHAVARGSAAIGAVSLHVCGAAQICL